MHINWPHQTVTFSEIWSIGLGFARKKYTGDFWEASSRLKLHDQLAKDQKQLQNLNVELRKATLANIKAQRLGKPAPLTQIAEISTRKRETEKLLRSEANSPSTLPPPPRAPNKRLRRLPMRYRSS